MQNPPISLSFAGSSAAGATNSGATEQSGGFNLGTIFGAGSYVNNPPETKNEFQTILIFAAAFAVGWFAYSLVKKLSK